jgi:hypothetical protein
MVRDRQLGLRRAPPAAREQVGSPLGSPRGTPGGLLQGLGPAPVPPRALVKMLSVRGLLGQVLGQREQVRVQPSGWKRVPREETVGYRNILGRARGYQHSRKAAGRPSVRERATAGGLEKEARSRWVRQEGLSGYREQGSPVGEMAESPIRGLGLAEPGKAMLKILPEEGGWETVPQEVPALLAVPGLAAAEQVQATGSEALKGAAQWGRQGKGRKHLEDTKAEGLGSRGPMALVQEGTEPA